MAIYYISDLHFNHKRIIELCNRPYATVEEMNEDMIAKWNSVVTDKDEVYFLGDAGLPKNVQTQKEIANLIKRLNGKKHLIEGNHDHKIVKDTYFRREFESIAPYKRIKDNGRDVILCHYPFEDWDGKYRGSFHIHGHIHNNKEAVKTVIPNRFNVSAEVINYTPITLDQLIESKPIKVKVACNCLDEDMENKLVDLTMKYKVRIEGVLINSTSDETYNKDGKRTVLKTFETKVPAYNVIKFYEEAEKIGAIRG